jgi:hypothetical protein
MLFLYVRMNGRQGVAAAKGKIIGVGCIVIGKLLLDTLPCIVHLLR